MKFLKSILCVALLLSVLKTPVAAGFLLVAAASCGGMGACCLICGSLFKTDAARLRERTMRCWLLGILLVVTEIWALASLPPKGPLALVFLAFDLYCLARTCGSLASWIASGVCQDARWQPGVGGLLLGASAAAPVVGWALGLQLLLVSLGAAICPRRWQAA
jgi:hypothetical protein